ncbi:MAG TPA: methyltransferase domain-containing protein [Blastocatellia bacterium]|jgi:ubiquinone/menaquinone biosynthesis C-methylase UbiE|nr:methyltransferase domain-containing protein [Blastocatellia bacterium]
MNHQIHNQSIVDQFTKQAIPFSQKPQLSSEEILDLMVGACGVTPQDVVLDVACGPGLTACALAKAAARVTGIDITPAMIERAKARQAEMGLTNLTWRVGDILSLPFPDESFSLVVTRYSFHHLLDPGAALAEMMRALKPGGRVMVMDAAPESSKVDAYNRMEKLRDPSHVRAMPPEELLRMAREAGLVNVRTAFCKVEFELEKTLAASFPNPGDEEKLRQIFSDDLMTDTLGMGAHRRGGEIHFHYPTIIIVGVKPE